MKKIKSRVMALTVASMFLLTSTTVLAAETNFTLTTSQTSSISSNLGLYKTGGLTGSNSADSSSSVFLILRSSFAGKGWVTRGEVEMAKGKTGSISTITLDEGASWQGELNPWWWGGKGCIASGKLTAN